jgi:hypothetical protein
MALVRGRARHEATALPSRETLPAPNGGHTSTDSDGATSERDVESERAPQRFRKCRAADAADIGFVVAAVVVAVAVIANTRKLNPGCPAWQGDVTAPFDSASTCPNANGMPDPYYPIFHVRPERNWVNDPNGPMYDPLHDKYHLWMQYNPCGPTWGNMAWYHTVSDDLVFFKRLGVTFDRDKTYDESGCWSGSVTFVNGDPVILYTCVDDSNAQRQCAAVPINRSDPFLTNWTKVETNPLIAPPSPTMLTTFRDPTTGWHVPNSSQIRIAERC